jgi:hypothetical protein
MQFSPLSCHFIPLQTKYSPQHPVLKHPHWLLNSKYQGSKNALFQLCILVLCWICYIKMNQLTSLWWASWMEVTKQPLSVCFSFQYLLYQWTSKVTLFTFKILARLTWLLWRSH